MDDTLLLVLAVTGAGVVSGLTGFGFGLIAAGGLLSIKPPVEATAIVLACSILSQGLSILRLRTKPPLAETGAMMVAGLVGTPIGIYLLHDLSSSLVKGSIGGFRRGP